MQPGYDDNYTDDSFLEEMVMNANVVKRDFLRVMVDSVSISQYLCIVALVVSTWTHTLNLAIDEITLLKFDIGLLLVGFLVLLLTTSPFSLNLLLKYVLNISFFTSGLYVLAPIAIPLPGPSVQIRSGHLLCSFCWFISSCMTTLAPL